MKLTYLVHKLREDVWAFGFERQQFLVDALGDTEPPLLPPFPNGIEVVLVFDDPQVGPP
jgi:hypothetical protein